MRWWQVRKRNADLERELRSDLELEEEEQRDYGLSPEEARYAARRAFGNATLIREQTHEAWGLAPFERLSQDIHFALRQLRRSPVFGITTILILGLGIGANIAVFTVVNSILLRPLPFRDPNQLVWVMGNKGNDGLPAQSYSVDAYEDYQAQNHSLLEITAYDPFFGASDYKLTGQDTPRPVSGVVVAGNFFNLLGIQPKIGRLFLREDALYGSRAAVLLSEPFWRRQFAANPGIVGQSILLNDTSVTVIGVIPATFDFGSAFAPGKQIDIFRPAIADTMRDSGNVLSIIGRLRPGVSVSQAQSEANLLFPRFSFNKKHPEWGKDYRSYTGTVLSLKDHISGKLRRSLIVLWCAVGMILLIVCVNLANLLLARSTARGKEFAMRIALGAGRGQLVRQLMTEGLVLSAAGAALGLGFAFVVLLYLAHQGSFALPLLDTVSIDGLTLAWTIVIALIAALLFGLVPALNMPVSSLQESLRGSGPGLSAGRQGDRIRTLLVISEVALSCILLVGAGLLLRSFLQLLDTDLGFRPDRVAAIQVDYIDTRNAAYRAAVLKQMLDRVKSIPGIDQAAITNLLPLDRTENWGLWAQERSAERNKEASSVEIVSQGYLKTMGIRLVKGRDFGWEDTLDREHVVIINETLAGYEWPGVDPIGRMAEPGDRRVIGVVADVRETEMETTPGREFFVPVTQENPRSVDLVVCTSLPPNLLAGSVLRTLREMNPEQPATEFRTIQQLVDHASSPRRFFALLVSIFAGTGLLLASLGIYGVISYSIARQTQAIGIRIALGATRTRVQLDVLWGTMRLVLIGISVGVVASLGVAQLMASLLFGVKPTDPVTFTAMITVLGTVALLAGYLPARRASRIDPIVALRMN